ncbi:MAG TPA: hypothetical protein VFW65_22735 [Pseudonocardiaceae bacterium]|nr:hypothetical protein [Pseudonocardiaceae bacterium]
MGDGYVVSPTDLLHASQSMDSAVDQLRETSDQLKKAELPATVLGTDQYLAAITSAWNKAVSAREQDIKKCAEILDGMIEALGDTITAYHEGDAETAKHFNESTEAGIKEMEQFGEKYDPMKPPELDGNGDVSGGDSGAGADAGAAEGDSGAGDSGTDGATESGGATDSGGAGESGPAGGACGEHPTIE